MKHRRAGDKFNDRIDWQIVSRGKLQRPLHHNDFARASDVSRSALHRESVAMAHPAELTATSSR